MTLAGPTLSVVTKPDPPTAAPPDLAPGPPPTPFGSRLARSVESVFWVYAMVALAGNPFRELDTYRSQVFRPLYATELLVPAIGVAFLVGRDPLGPLRLLRTRAAVVALFALGPISAIWSSNPQNTFVLSLDLFVTFAAATVLVHRRGARQAALLVTAGAAVLLGMSAAVAAWGPSLAIDADGKWRGVFDHKNYLATVACLGAVSGAVLLADALQVARPQGWAGAGRRRWPSGDPEPGAGRSWTIGTAIAIPVVTLGLAWLVMARSGGKTAMATAVLVVTVGAIATRLTRWQATRANIAGLAAGLGALVAFGVWVSGQDQFSRLWKYDRTFNQRTVIWDALAPFVRARWLNGFGMGAFYTDSGGFAVAARRRAGTQAGVLVHAHSGFYEHVLDFGIVGVVVLLCALVPSVARALSGAYRRVRPAGLWPLAIIATLLCVNVTEPKLLWPTGFHTLVLAVALVAAGDRGDTSGRPAAKERRPRSSPATARNDAVWRKARLGLAGLVTVLILAAVVTGGPGSARPYSQDMVESPFDERGVTLSPAQSGALRYLAFRLDSRADLQKAFGGAPPVNVRDLLQWALNPDNGDVPGLEPHRPAYLELVTILDSIPSLAP